MTVGEVTYPNRWEVWNDKGEVVAYGSTIQEARRAALPSQRIYDVKLGKVVR